MPINRISSNTWSREYVVTWSVFTARRDAVQYSLSCVCLSLCLSVFRPSAGAYSVSAIFHSEVKKFPKEGAQHSLILIPRPSGGETPFPHFTTLASLAPQSHAFGTRPLPPARRLKSATSTEWVEVGSPIFCQVGTHGIIFVLPPPHWREGLGRGLCPSPENFWTSEWKMVQFSAFWVIFLCELVFDDQKQVYVKSSLPFKISPLFHGRG